MPPKPTCKVAKREGQRGARIDPKGCKVRTAKDAQGNKKKQNKQARRRSSAQRSPENHDQDDHGQDFSGQRSIIPRSLKNRKLTDRQRGRSGPARASRFAHRTEVPPSILA
jgi:hypothetical protein